MADAPVVHIGENSAEHIAYKLLNHVAVVEGVGNSGFGNFGDKKWDRQQLLDAYAECMRAVRMPGRRLNKDERTRREERAPVPFGSVLAGRTTG
ncbi:MAG: hypothetical protein ABW042_01930 [Phenylobacterium sp.]